MEILGFNLYRLIVFAIIITYEFTRNLYRFLGCGPRFYNITADISEKVVVITGANSGLGKIVANELASLGAKVIIGCRDLDKGKDTVKDIIAQNPDSNLKIRLLELDLSSLDSVRRFAQQVSQDVSRVDILINNAGVMACPKAQTEDGFEIHFQTNYLGHFLLTHLLVERLNASPAARVVNLGSHLYMIGDIDFDDLNHENSYSPFFIGAFRCYAQSKLAMVLFTRELANRLKQTKIKAYCVHPGWPRTEITRHLYDNLFIGFGAYFVTPFIFVDAFLGAQTTLYCATDEGIAKESGCYYRNCAKDPFMTGNAKDDDTAKQLWTMSCELVNV